MINREPLRRRLVVRGHAPEARGGQGRRVSVAGTSVGVVAGVLLGAALWCIFGVHQPTNGSSPAWEPDCTVLALDRRQGHTTAGPCLDHAPALRQADASARP